MRIKKAVILAAGFGTRFMPAGKAVPKVLFPVIDRPIIQIIVEEIVKAGIKEIVFVVSPNTYPAIKRHFFPYPALNKTLEKGQKTDTLQELKRIERLAKYSFVLQKPGRIGTGVALLSAKRKVGKEPFLMMYSDDFCLAEPGYVVQLVRQYNDPKSCLVGCMRREEPEYGARLGFVKGEMITDRLIKVADFVEKPGVGKAPSPFASMCGMILAPDVFKYLEQLDKDLEEGKELYIIEGVKKMIQAGSPVLVSNQQTINFMILVINWGI